jgi:hypothetical protein
VSTNLIYTNGPFYATVAYERHEKVNRQINTTAIYGTAVLPDTFAQSLSTRSNHPGLDHLGIQVENCDELQEVYGRLHKARGKIIEQGQTSCCHAAPEKSWIDDPAGIAREAFFTTGEITHYGDGRGERDMRVADEKRSGKRHRVRQPPPRRPPAAQRRGAAPMALCQFRPDLAIVFSDPSGVAAFVVAPFV